MTAAEIILAAVTLQRAAELLLSRPHTPTQIARGAPAAAPGHKQPVDVVALGGYFILQGFRVWILRTLGSRWTTRIIVLPRQSLVMAGPYRFLSHPNYAVVAGEIAVLPLVLGLPLLAALFTVLNAAVLAIRIRAENRALAASCDTMMPGTP